MGGGGGGEGGLVETNFQLLMLSPNLLKYKKNFTRGFAENFLSFQAKKCLGMVLDFEYQVVHVYTVYANHKNSGALNAKLPTLLLMADVKEFGSKILVKPKSPSLTMAPLSDVEVRRILMGLMSL